MTLVTAAKPRCPLPNVTETFSWPSNADMIVLSMWSVAGMSARRLIGNVLFDIASQNDFTQAALCCAGWSHPLCTCLLGRNSESKQGLGRRAMQEV